MKKTDFYETATATFRVKKEDLCIKIFGANGEEIGNWTNSVERQPIISDSLSFGRDEEQEKIDRIVNSWVKWTIVAIVLVGLIGLFMIGYGIVNHNPFGNS